MNDERRRAKEAWIALDNHGTTALELCALVAFLPTALLVRYAVSTRPSMALDAVVLGGASVLVTTAPDWVVETGLPMCAAVGLAGALLTRRWRKPVPEVQPDGRLASLTWFRFFTQTLTVASILAVDFGVFPRRLAKTEQFGVSLMDLGVGSVVFISGIVSSKTPPLGVAVRRALPVIALGVGRYALVRLLNYQEHVTEYGVHWNFFLTLALVAIAPSAAAAVGVPQRHSAAAGLALAGAYQVLLSTTSLQDFALHGSRDGGWFAMNREGVLSLAGYVSIYFVARAIGQRLRAASVSGTAQIVKVASSWAAALFAGQLALQYLLNLQVSRRLANAPFVLMMLWFHTGQLLLLLAASHLARAPAPPRKSLVDCVSRHQLVFFLAGNVLTGLFNMGLDTLAASPALARVIVTAHVGLALAAAVLCGKAVKPTCAAGSS